MEIKRTLNGFIEISDIINGYLKTRKYAGYSIKEAKKKFKKEFNLI